jgi:recombination protein RecT
MTSTALAKTDAESLRPLLEKMAPKMAAVLPKFVTPERVVQLTLVAAVKNPEILSCSRESIALAVMRSAQWGLDIGETVHLVPFGKVCTAVADYRGLIQLAREARIIRDITPYVVYQGDHFEYEYGLDERLRHVPCNTAKRGPLTHAWCLILKPMGIRAFHVMPIEDIELIRGKSRSWGPSRVKECPPWYAMKTCIRNYLSKQPKTAGRLGEVIEADEAADQGLEIPAGVTLDGEVTEDTGDAGR